MADLMERVQQVFRDVFADADLELEPHTGAEDVEGWDSVAHVNLLVALERAFRVRFTTAEMARLTREGQTVGDLLDLMAAKLGGGERERAAGS